MIRKLPVAEIIVTVLALAAGAGVYWYAHRDQGALEESKERGAAIVEALDSYRAATGTYPADLDDLVPTYIAAIEPPTWGLERWRYRRYTPAEVVAGATAPATGAEPAPVEASADEVYFQLSVAANETGYPVLYYDYAASRWVINN
jgi:type II secretory pathway pseudopilin PulG